MDRLWSESLYAGLFFSLSSSLRCSLWCQSNEKCVCPAWLKTNTWWDWKQQWERAGQNVFDQASILQVQIVMLRSERGVFFADRTIFLFFSLVAGPPWLLCNTGLSVWVGKINNARLRIFFFINKKKKKKEKVFLCILIAEQFAYLHGKWRKKKSLALNFPIPCLDYFLPKIPSYSSDSHCLCIWLCME